jgi:cellulose 1,4-beta-cellobiosidase
MASNPLTDGNAQAEEAPALSYETCTESGCSGRPSKVVLDANWRWIRDGQSTNCFAGADDWLCAVSGGASGCRENCVLEGISTAGYGDTYGIRTTGSELTIDYVTHGQYGINYGARTYLMDADDTKLYKMVKFAGPDSYQEFSFDVDVSAIPCGLNGALYLSEMNANGSASAQNARAGTAGAEYGTGYCDAQCFRDIKYINGEINLPASGTSGLGQYGACCMEMDIWEANSQSQALTPHNCARNGGDDNADPVIACESAEQCGDGDLRFQGVCDKNGCDLNPFRFAQGDQALENFYGPGTDFTVNTDLPMTVVTQFVQDANQDVTEIRRLYVQNGQVIGQPQITVVDPRTQQTHTFDSITDNMCDVTKLG